MNNKNIVLLNTMLKSTSIINKIKHSKDKKVRKKAIGNLVGLLIIYIMIVSYSIMACIGYGQMGIVDVIPAMCVLSISGLAFIFTFLKTNGYLFNFKEYDMIMSLPYKARVVAACKFLYMYIKSFPWYASISIAFLIGYGIYAKPSWITYVTWLILMVIIPLIPMLVAAFLGFIIARISVGFKKHNIVQTIIMFLIILLAFTSRFIIEGIFREQKQNEVLTQISNQIQNSLKYYPPGKWFVNAIIHNNVIDYIMLLASSFLLFSLMFMVVGKSYRKINSALKSHATSKAFHMTTLKKKSIVWTIAFKEFKRFTSSTNYLVNCGMGEVLAVILGLSVLFVGFDKVIAVITNGAPLKDGMLLPAIPFIVHFLIGMVSTTVCSPSLEGKNYWIVQTLPITKKQLYHGKMLFNLCLMIPLSVFTTLCMSISAHAPLINTILYVITSIILCVFATTWGCVCGVKFMKLEWENELEVIKQSAGVAVYLFPNMMVCMGLVVLIVYLGTKMNSNIVVSVFAGMTALLAVLCYVWAMKLVQKSRP